MNHALIDELVSAWQAARDRGKPRTVAELCPHNPELAAAVAQRIANLGDLPTNAGGSGSVASAPTIRTGDPPTPPVSHFPPSLGGYRIDGILGQGGMGAIYRAHDERLGRAVALKTMKRELAAELRAKDRFLREARAAAQIEHDNVVPIWQVGEDAGIPFLAMPLLHGESLAGRLQRERVSPLGVTLKVGREVAEGLAAAHARGLIHRDIKPANIWLEGDPAAADPAARLRRCKILDFGLVRPSDDEEHLTATGVVVGTPGYMSPEQAAGNPVDFRSDLFSLGTLLYRMATGEQPFAGTSVMSVLTNLALHNPPPPATKNPSIPPSLSDLIMKLLTKDPAGRPASAREVATNLREISRQLSAARKSAVPGILLTAAAAPTASLAPAAPTVQTSNPWADLDTEARPRSRPTAPTARRDRPRGPWKWVAVGLLFLIGGGVLLQQIILRITDKDGKVKQEIPLQPGDRFEAVQAKGDKAAPIPAASVKVREVPKEPAPAAAAVVPPPAAAPTDPARRAAEWALGCGGKVRIKLGEAERPVVAVKDLPADLFILLRVVLDDCGDNVTDAGLERLTGLQDLTHLYLVGTSVTDAGMEHLKRLGTLVDLRLSRTQVSDAGLERLKGLNRITHLGLFKTSVSDAGLAHLSGMSGLADLDLNSTSVTDAGLAKLKQFTKLVALSVYDTQVTDAGLEHLKALPALTSLALGGPQITDAGLAHLKGLTGLTILSAGGPELGDAGLTHLEGLTGLTTLVVGGQHVGDAGLAHLKGLTGLTYLLVDGPQITDAGLEHLRGLTKLTELHLVNTKATQAGTENLRKALPKCTVVLQ